jgi:polar amino acid transport system substrate-binding protein
MRCMRGTVATALRYWLTTCAVVGVILGSVTPAQAQAPLPEDIKARGKLVVGVKCDFPPLGYVDADDRNVGFEIDVVHELARLAFGSPDKVEFVCVAGPNRIPFITSGRVDMIVSVLSYTADRAKVIRFSKPYLDSGVRMVAPLATKIGNWADLKGQTITTTTGGTPAIWMDRCMKDAHQLVFDNTADSIAAVKQGRAVAYAQDITLLVGIVAKDHSLKIIGDSEVRGPINVGMKLDNAALGAWLDESIDTMTSSDFFWKDLTKWVPADVLSLFTDAVPRPGGRTILNSEADDIYKCP